MPIVVGIICNLSEARHIFLTIAFSCTPNRQGITPIDFLLDYLGKSVHSVIMFALQSINISILQHLPAGIAHEFKVLQHAAKKVHKECLKQQKPKNDSSMCFSIDANFIAAISEDINK